MRRKEQGVGGLTAPPPSSAALVKSMAPASPVSTSVRGDTDTCLVACDQTSNYRSSAWDRVGAQPLGAVIVVITQMIAIKCKSVTITDPFFLPKLVSALVMLFVVSQVL